MEPWLAVWLCTRLKDKGARREGVLRLLRQPYWLSYGVKRCALCDASEQESLFLIPDDLYVRKLTTISHSRALHLD